MTQNKNKGAKAKMAGSGTYNEAEAHLGRSLVNLIHRQVAQFQLVLSVAVVVLGRQIRRSFLSALFFLL